MKTYTELKKLMLEMGFQRINKNGNFYRTSRIPKTRLYDRGVEWVEDSFIIYDDGDCIIGWL
jgi:hypothetical protein